MSRIAGRRGQALARLLTEINIFHEHQHQLDRQAGRDMSDKAASEYRAFISAVAHARHGISLAALDYFMTFSWMAKLSSYRNEPHKIAYEAIFEKLSRRVPSRLSRLAYRFGAAGRANFRRALEAWPEKDLRAAWRELYLAEFGTEPRPWRLKTSGR